MNLTIIIIIILALLTMGIVALLFVFLLRTICTKWLFHYSNDDEEYMKRCRKYIDQINPIGERMLNYAKEQQLAEGTQIMITIDNGNVLFDDGNRRIELNEEEKAAMLALDEVFMPKMMNRCIFHRDRVGFHSQLSWKACIYTRKDSKPRYVYLKKESFQSRCKKVAPHWYMMFA